MLSIGLLVEHLLDIGENIASINKTQEGYVIMVCNCNSYHILLTFDNGLYAHKRYYNKGRMYRIEKLVDIELNYYNYLE